MLRYQVIFYKTIKMKKIYKNLFNKFDLYIYPYSSSILSYVKNRNY